MLNNNIIEALEQLWGFRLPNEYKNFLIEYNGGEPVPNGFSFKNLPENGSYIDVFFGILKHDNNNLLVNMEMYKNRIPNNFIPIGDDPGGNLILISVKNKDRGKIYFWDHEMEANTEAGEIADYTNLTLIADSFDEFMNGLHSFDENEESEILDPGSK
jgi:hypothetical protein